MVLFKNISDLFYKHICERRLQILDKTSGSEDWEYLSVI